MREAQSKATTEQLAQTQSHLFMVIMPALAELKKQNKNNTSRNQATEELQKHIAVSEAACPGITDKKVKKLIEKRSKAFSR